MALFEKLVGTEEPKLPVHQFTDALNEWQDGEVTRAQIITAFGLDVADEADLDFIKGKYLAATDKVNFIRVVEGILRLGEVRLLGYEVKANFVARINGLP